MKIFCFGDSNTYGYAPAGPFGDRLPEEQTWPFLLGQKLEAEVYNAGENGRCVPRNPAVAALELAADREHLPADRMIVMLGTNDLMYPPYLSAQETASRLKVFLQYLQKKYPQTMLCLVSPVPVLSGPASMQAESRKLAEEYRKISESLQIAFCNAAAWNIPLEWDGIHFTVQGHTLFAEKLAAVLTGLC